MGGYRKIPIYVFAGFGRACLFCSVQNRSHLGPADCLSGLLPRWHSGSHWVAFKHFTEMFQYEQFYDMLRNTLLINVFSLVFLFPLPIVLAIMLNEVRHEVFKRINQSILYIPHFLSWVIISSLTYFMFSTDVGIFNKVIRSMGREAVGILNEPNYFWGLLTLQNI